MFHDTERFVDLDFEQAVRQRAYLLWEREGRQEGREKEYWFQALKLELAAREQDGSRGTAPPVRLGVLEVHDRAEDIGPGNA